MIVVVVCAMALTLGSCGSDSDPVAPLVPPVSDLGSMPDVPKPTDLNNEAESDTVQVIKPLRAAFVPHVLDARTDWQIKTQNCDEEFWIVDCGGWSTKDYPDSWMDDLTDKWGHQPPRHFKAQLCDKDGEPLDPVGYEYSKNKLNHRRCGFLDCCLCWSNARWSAVFRKVADPPYLCRDRFWVIAGKSTILPPGFSQEITTTVTTGVEKTECDEWAASVTVEGEVTNGYATLKTTIEASYSRTVTKTVFEETKIATRYTPEPVPAGKQAVYQVWVLVDRYTLTDKDGKPYHDANYAFPHVKRVHVQGVWEAHAITYFPATASAGPEPVME